MRHPAADRDDLTLVHVTHFNDAVLGLRARRRRASSSTASSIPGYRYTRRARRAPRSSSTRRAGAARVTGTDLLDALRASGVPLDLFGMDARARSGGVEDLPQAALHDEMAAPPRLPAPDPLDLARALAASRRCTSGMPVVALGDDRGAGGRARRRRASSPRASTCWPTALRAARWPTPTRRASAGARRARARARRATGCERFLADWDALLAGGDAHEDRDGLRAREPAGRARRRRRRRPERARRRARHGAGARAAPRSSSTRAATTRDLPRARRAGPGRRSSTTSTPGPPRAVPKDELLAAHAGVRRRELREQWRDRPARRRARPLLDVRAAPRCAPPREPRHPGRADLPRARRRSSAATRATKDTSPPRAASRIERDIAAPRRPRSSRPAPTRCSSCVRLGADRAAAHRRAVRRRPRAASGRTARASRARPAGARLVCVGRLVERKGIGDVDRGARAAARRRAASSPAARTRAGAGRPTRRPGGCARSPRRSASPTASSCAAGSSATSCRALLRSADVVVCVAVVRAVRDRAAGGDGLRRARSSPPRSAGMIDTVVDGVTGVHVPPRDPRAPGRAPCAPLLGRPGRARRSGARRRARARGARYDWDRDRAPRRSTSTPALARRRGRAAPARRERRRPLRARARRARRTSPRCAERAGRARRARPSGWSAGAQQLAARPARRRAAARRRQRRQRRAGAAPDRGARRPLPRPTAAPLSAICLHAETSALTAIGNDYGARARCSPARCARTAARATSWSRSPPRARSPNVLAAVERRAPSGHDDVGAHRARRRNPLAERVRRRASCVDAPHTATVQELHLVALHLLCARSTRGRAPGRARRRRRGAGGVSRARRRRRRAARPRRRRHAPSGWRPTRPCRSSTHRGRRARPGGAGLAAALAAARRARRSRS